MHVKNPLGTTEYRDHPIWDYEEKVDAEKERWRKLRAKHNDKIMEAQKAFYAAHPYVNVRNAKHMLEVRDPNHLNKIAKERNELKALAEQAGCKINTQMKRKDIQKCTAYFEKLIEKRDMIKKSGGNNVRSSNSI